MEETSETATSAMKSRGRIGQGS